MGVHGLWRLIEPSGKPVPLEALENKILAVDVSIWIHQAIRGFQDSRGAPLPNAHLLGIYHRVCKLLYFKIRPVFVFDGGVPALKKETIAKRNQLKSKSLSEAERIQKQLLETLLKHSAVSKVLSEKTKACLSEPRKANCNKDDLYSLPPDEANLSLFSSPEEETTESSETSDSSPTKHWDLHTIDMSSMHFKSLPADVRHEILTELKETRKQNSWGRLHQLPKQSNDFSSYQMKRLLKRQAVQDALEAAKKEMGGYSLSLSELESILNDQGVITANNIGKRIASDENTRFLLINDIKKEMEKAREKEIRESIEQNHKDPEVDIKVDDKADLEFKEDLQRAIEMSLQEVPSTSTSKSECDEQNEKFSFLESFKDGDFGSDSDIEEVEICTKKKEFSSAKSYMMEYSGLTPCEISKILNTENADKKMKSDGKNLVKHSKEKDIRESEVEIHIVKENEQKEIVENQSVKIASIDESQNPLENKNIYKSVEHSAKIMSDTDESVESDDFIDVSEENCLKKPVEIVIDPKKSVDEEDDLFSDIFASNKLGTNLENQNAIVPESNALNIVLDPNKFTKPKDAITKKVLLKDKITTKHQETKNITFLEPLISAENLKILRKDNTSLRLEDSSGKPEVEKEIPKAETKSLETKKEESERLTLNLDEMKDLQKDFQQESNDLLAEKSKKERMGSNITDQMYQEAQELLELFGVPYVIAPMEAEAQCAFLEEIDLTQGTITDDSDIWLFGGKTVYKNFFDQTKYVKEFRSENIKHYFKLTREQMILLALLVGSDYTTGLQGVGPVTALEILAAFPPSQTKEFSLSHNELLSGLKEFRSWFLKGKSGGLGLVRTSLKNKLKNINFTENFPSMQVVQAYLDPTIEPSKEKFSWGRPKVATLKSFARDKFGWTAKKAEEILNPVIQRMEEHRMQKSIKDYFNMKVRFDTELAEGVVSRRVKKALNDLGKTKEELEQEEIAEMDKAVIAQKHVEGRVRKSKTAEHSKKGCRKRKIKEDSEILDESKKKPKQNQKKSFAGYIHPTEDYESEALSNEECVDIATCKPTSKQVSGRTKKSEMEEKSKKDLKKNKSEKDSQNLDKKQPNKDFKESGKISVQKQIRSKIRKSGTEEKSIKSFRKHKMEKDPQNLNDPKPEQSKKQSFVGYTDLMAKVQEPKQPNENLKECDDLSKVEKNFKKPENLNEDFKKYEELAAELRKRREKKSKIEADTKMPQKKRQIKKLSIETIPEELASNEDVKILLATTTESLKRTKEINEKIKLDLEDQVKRNRLLHTKGTEVIHQRLRDKSDSLKNKMKAIEVFRKSKKGPGYVKKREKRVNLLKENAELSESSSSE